MTRNRVINFVFSGSGTVVSLHPVYVYMYICIYVYMCIYTYMCICVHNYAYMCISLPENRSGVSPFCGFYVCSVRFLFFCSLARQENSCLSARLIMLDPRIEKKNKQRWESGNRSMEIRHIYIYIYRVGQKNTSVTKKAIK